MKKKISQKKKQHTLKKMKKLNKKNYEKHARNLRLAILLYQFLPLCNYFQH